MATGNKTEIHVGDVGTAFIINVTDDGAIVDITLATLMQIIFTKPTIDDVPGVKITKTAVHVNTGSDGKMQYLTEDDPSNILDVAGKWNIQGYVELPTGKWSSSISGFTVHDNL